MIQYERITTEEGLRKTFRDDPSLIWKVKAAHDEDTIVCAFTFRFSVPARYAKAVLRDVLDEAKEEI